MTFKQILSTSAAQVMAQKLNAASQAALMQTVALRAKNAREAADLELRNLANAALAKANEALAKATVLDDFEKGQLEEAFVQFLTTSGLQSVLAAMSFNIDGQSYTLASVVEKLVQRDDIEVEDFTYNADGLLDSAVYTLQDGYQVQMAYTRTDLVDQNTGLPTGDIQFDGTANNWRGFQVAERFTFRGVKQSMTIEGVAYEHIADHQLVFRSHIQYDLTPLLTPATALNGSAPDLNADGVIGNNAGAGGAGAGGAGTGDAGTGDAGTGDAGTGDAGTGDTGTGDAGTGDTGTGDTGTGDAGTGDAGTGDAGSIPTDENGNPV